MRNVNAQSSFADLEFLHQGVRLDGVLLALSNFLDPNEQLVSLVHQDLIRGLKSPKTGREGLDAVRVLRSFLLRRIQNWDFRELRERIADGISLRQFTTFYSEPVPSYRAFHSAFTRLTPLTVRALNQAVVQAAVALGIDASPTLRVDTTVTETDIHHPTDSSLLWDGVRVLCRLVSQVGQIAPELTQGFHDHTRRARRRMQEISRLEQRERQRRQKRKYRDLVKVTEETVAQARIVAQRAEQVQLPDLMHEMKLRGLKAEILLYCERVERVLSQTRRRVFEGQQVPVEEKIFSLFEPHTDLIKRGKVQKPVEFGHKIFLAETRSGLVTDYRVLKGNPSDEHQVAPSLEHHQQLFGAAPKLYAADRGFYSQANLDRCAQAGVEAVCIPYRGPQRTAEREAVERSRPFKKGQQFRAGIEGRISVLFRGRGMKRCLDEGWERFELFVGAAVLANNLLVIARHLSKKRHRSSRGRSARRL